MAGRGDTNRPREQEMDEIVPSVGNAGGASGGAISSTAPTRDDVALDIDDDLFEKAEQQFQLQMETTRARDGFLIISRVREQTRNVRPGEYTPHYVPIGPYHSSSSSQRRIDEKFKCLYICLDASNRPRDDKKVLLGQLRQKMKDPRSDASRCYSDYRFDGRGAQNDFFKMLLLDGCYLLACFAGILREQEDGRETQQAATIDTASRQNVNDEAVAVRETWYLLENQIPFFVVQEIYELVTGKNRSTVLNRFKSHVKNLLHAQRYISKTDPPTSDMQAPSHLLHLVHTYFTQMENPPAAQAEGGASENPPAAQAEGGACENPPAAQAEGGASENPPAAQAEGGASDSSGTGRFRRATEYCRYANVRFHHRKFDGRAVRSVLDVSHDVRLADGSLLLLVPLLRVDNNTWTILRNLMALEEHHAVPLRRRVTAYCLFMSQLACTEEDVALLVRSRVLEHFLGSDAEVAAGFADLCKGVVLNVDDLSSNYLKPVWHELERRYRSRWQNLVALFRQTHGRNLLYAAAFVAAVILFASQVLQGIFTIMATA